MRAAPAVLLLALLGITACGLPEAPLPDGEGPLSTQTARAGAACFQSCNINYQACLDSYSWPASLICPARRQGCYDGCGLQDDIPPPSSVTFYGVGNGNGDNSSDVFSFVYSGGSISSYQKLGEAGTVLTDIATHPSSRVMYASSGTGVLYTLNTFTGGATTVMSIPAGINALDFCGSGNTLYAWGGTQLYSIDTANLTWSTLGDVGYTSAGDLGCSLWGTLYGIASEGGASVFIRLSRGGGAVRIGNLGWSQVYGFEIDQTDRAYGAVSYGNSIILLNVDPNTGAASALASYPTTAGMNGLTTYNAAY